MSVTGAVAIGEAVGEAVIWTLPWRPESDLAEYEQPLLPALWRLHAAAACLEARSDIARRGVRALLLAICFSSRVLATLESRARPPDRDTPDWVGSANGANKRGDGRFWLPESSHMPSLSGLVKG